MLSESHRLAGSSLLLTVLFVSTVTVSAESGVSRGMSVEEAIAALEKEGLRIFYSSDLIKPWMRVGEEQDQSSKPQQALAQILAPHGLMTRPGPDGSLLIVRDRSGSNPARPAGGVFTATREHEGNQALPPPAPPLEEVVVAASQYELSRAVSTSHAMLSSEDIEYLPDLGDDALRAVNRLPGTATNGFSARSNVRGGEVGETLVRFDDLRLYDPFHLKDFQGVFSTVDPRVVSSMDVYTGGFPAVFGDRMSSVIDVVSLPAPATRYHEIAMSFFNASALTSGTFTDGKGEWLASARRSNLDLLYNAFSSLPERPRYLDAFAKLSYQINPSLTVTGNVLYFADDIHLSDDVDQEEQASANDEDRYVWLRVDHSSRSAFAGTTLLAHSQLNSHRNGFSEKAGISTGRLDDRRSFTVDSLQSDWSWQPTAKLLVQYGGSINQLEGRYDYEDAVEFDLLFDTPGVSGETARTRAIRARPRGDQYALYASVRYSPTPRLATDFGLRWDKQTLDPAHKDTIGPRIGVRYRLAERTYLRGSWGRFHQSQAINELQVEDGVRTFLPPQRSDHLVVGLEHDFPKGMNLRVEAYDKDMGHLRPRYENLLNSLTLLPELKPDRIEIAPSGGRARGMELLLSQRLDSPLSWWLAYSWSWVRDRVEGRDVYRSWDQTHAASAGLNWDTPKWNLGFGLVYRSGWPTTPVSFDSSGAIPIVRTEGRNTDRVDFYRSADLRLTRKFDLDDGAFSVFMELTNLFGRNNPCCTEYEIENIDQPLLELTTLNYLPLVPSFGFIWNF